MEWPSELAHIKEKFTGLGWECIEVIYDDFDLTGIDTFVLVRPPSRARRYYQLRSDGSEGFAPAVMGCF